jgi:hypothetical protein
LTSEGWYEGSMTFLKAWLSGLLHPARAMDALRTRTAPHWGLVAVLVRFVGTVLFVALPLALLGCTPFTPSYLEFIRTEEYYRVWVYLFPLFGVFTWLLMFAFAELVLRLSSHQTTFDHIANVVGKAMLIPMPMVWVWDLTMILTGGYSLVVMAVSHTIFQMWETA